MESVLLKNFKAHKNELNIPLKKKNFLLYGDNGAGKSSIYEALKLVFFNNRLVGSITKGYAQEEHEEKLKEFYRSLNNTIEPIQDFMLRVNTADYQDFQKETYNVYMLNLDDVFFHDYLKLDILLKKVFFSLPNTIIEKYTEIESKVNLLLESFLEEITIKIDSEDEFCIKITDVSRNLVEKKDIKKYFNEAKLNLVVFALLFSTIEVSKNNTKNNILILDDFITSLDMSNRTFIMRHILDTFKDFQILIFTHNVYFYNLIMYLINDDICTTMKEWQFANLYEIGNEHKMYINSDFQKIDDIEKDYDKEIQKASPSFTDIGNKLRQKFERLLYELSKIIMIGGVEESNKILDTVLNDHNIYLLKYEEGSGRNKKTKYKDSNSLVDELHTITTDLADIHTKINDSKIYELDNVKEILKTLKLYRKVSMHSLSHGQNGQHNWSDKEIRQTLILLKKLETNIKDLTNYTSN